MNLTVLVPCVAPKFAPVIVTGVPITPEVGLKLVMLGAADTVNVTALLAIPDTVTMTGPVVAPVGTGATMLVELQLVGLAAVPLNVTVLAPCVVPKFVPVMVTDVPTSPSAGDRLVMPGTGRMVKLTPLLDTPLTVTMTFPEVAPAGTCATTLVALQLTIDIVVPLSFTVLVP